MIKDLLFGNMKPKVVIIGRNYTSRLGMIRAVGMAGYDVTVIRTNGLPETKDIDAYSKYVTDYLYAKEPNRDELMSVLLSLSSEKYKTIIIPVDDYSASTIDENLDLLKADFLFPNINMKQGAINYLMDKKVQKELASQAGLNVTKGWAVGINDCHYSLPSDIIYPVFPKPQISFKGNKRCMVRCNNETELRSILDDTASQRDCPMLLEQFVEIEKEYALLGVSNGEDVIIPAMIQMLKSGSGAHRGVTLLGRVLSTDNYQGVVNQLKEFISSIHYCGLFDIDVYENNGHLYFNELNLRFGASGYAITVSGINLPQFFVSALKGQKWDHSDFGIKESIFVNEKVAFEDYCNGYISQATYKECISKADYCFVKSDIDINPYVAFISQNFSFKKRVKRLIKSILKRK